MTAKLVGKPKHNGQVGPGSNEPFHYTTESGVEIVVSSLAKPFRSAGELRKMRSAPPVEIAYFVIERDCNKEQLAAIDDMDMDEFNDKFSRQWAEHSGIDLGE